MGENMSNTKAIEAAREALAGLSLSLSLDADLRGYTGLSKKVDKALAALPVKPMTEEEIERTIVTCINTGRYTEYQVARMIIRALKAHNCLYVEDK